MKHKIEFTVKIQAEIDFELKKEAFLDIPFYSIKILTSSNDGKISQVVPVNFLSYKTVETKFLD